MKEWKYDNGIKVCESEFENELGNKLHCFKVYNVDEYLGTIYPRCIEDEESMIDDLDDGYEPVSNYWEDRRGNRC